ncbi:hypothetical protein, partial [Vibrio cholerae]
YFNASNLFFSLNGKEFNTAINGSNIQVEKGKTAEASDAFYKSISDFKRAAFLIRVLGQEDIRTALDQYHSNSIDLRKEILNLRGSLDTPPTDNQSIRDLLSGTNGKLSYATRVSNLEKEFNDCVRRIASYKMNLKK